MTEFKVLWFDDEHETLETIKEDALDNGIQLIGYSSATEGLNELNNNAWQYDGVLVDGFFHLSPENKGLATNKKAFEEVAFKLVALKENGDYLPWFIYSGQSTFVKDKNELIELFKNKANGGKVFDKNNDEDFEELCELIKSAATDIELTKLRLKYNQVFQVCTEKYLGADLQKEIVKIIKAIENVEDDKSVNASFNDLRKVVERIIHKLAENNLVPSDIVSDRGWINGASLFLSNIHSSYKHNNEFIHPLIAHTFHRLLDVTHDGSHSEGSLKLKVDGYLKLTGSLYTYKSCVYQLLELVLWYKNVIDEYSEASENINLWAKTPDTIINTNTNLVGIIEQDATNNYICNTYILDFNFTKENFSVGDQIEITEIVDNTNDRTNNMYPKRGHRYRKI